jgi:hypothetical protein
VGHLVRFLERLRLGLHLRPLAGENGPLAVVEPLVAQVLDGQAGRLPIGEGGDDDVVVGEVAELMRADLRRPTGGKDGP